MKIKLVQINTVSNGSIGRIMKEIQRQAEAEGIETISFVGRRKPYQDFRCEKFGNGFSFWGHVIINTVFDKQGHGSYFTTKRLVQRLRKEKPDIIHLHNLHGYYLHIPTFIKYLKEEYHGQIFWTFHDCWPFTGHCPYFTMAKCDKWMTECYNCPNKRQYPISWFFDASHSNYHEKKKWFSDIDNLTIIVPSQWMKRLVEKSFMKGYPIKVVSNGIDLNVFRRNKSETIRERYLIPADKKILLGVADVWSKRKGLDDFIDLGKVLPDDYVIVLVGVNRKQMRTFTNNIIGIPHTENQKELAELYSETHIFVNPSREESFSLVTAEAMACGTPSIVLDTSAVGELISEENGVVLHEHKAENYLKAVNKLDNAGVDRNQVAKCAMKYSASNLGKKVVEMYKRRNIQNEIL